MPLRLSQFGSWLQRTAQRAGGRDAPPDVRVRTPAGGSEAVRAADAVKSRASEESQGGPSHADFLSHNWANAVAESLSDRFMLWIDGVGAYQLCAGDQFLIGAPTQEDASPDICLLANLSRRHATLQRTGEDWFIHPHQATVVSGRPAVGPTLLRTGDAICLAGRVKLGFRIPSVLGGSALIDFESHHRPVHSVDGIILMTDRVLLGPRRDHHVCCADWPELVVIYRENGQLRCKSKAALTINGETARDSVALSDGAVIAGDDFRFRIERLKR